MGKLQGRVVLVEHFPFALTPCGTQTLNIGHTRPRCFPSAVSPFSNGALVSRQELKAKYQIKQDPASPISRQFGTSWSYSTSPHDAIFRGNKSTRVPLHGLPISRATVAIAAILAKKEKNGNTQCVKTKRNIVHHTHLSNIHS